MRAEDEDHAAGESWRCTDCNCVNRDDEAFCFRCGAGRSEFPARVGSVAVEDVERLQAAVDKAYSAMNSSAYVGGPSEREAWHTALAALGEVVTQHTGQADPVPSRSSTTRPEQPEPDVLGGQHE